MGTGHSSDNRPILYRTGHDGLPQYSRYIFRLEKVHLHHLPDDLSIRVNGLYPIDGIIIFFHYFKFSDQRAMCRPFNNKFRWNRDVDWTFQISGCVNGLHHCVQRLHWVRANGLALRVEYQAWNHYQTRWLEYTWHETFSNLHCYVRCYDIFLTDYHSEWDHGKQGIQWD